MVIYGKLFKICPTYSRCRERDADRTLALELLVDNHLFFYYAAKMMMIAASSTPAVTYLYLHLFYLSIHTLLYLSVKSLFTQTVYKTRTAATQKAKAKAKKTKTHLHHDKS